MATGKKNQTLIPSSIILKTLSCLTFKTIISSMIVNFHYFYGIPCLKTATDTLYCFFLIIWSVHLILLYTKYNNQGGGCWSGGQERCFVCRRLPVRIPRMGAFLFVRKNCFLVMYEIPPPFTTPKLIAGRCTLPEYLKLGDYFTLKWNGKPFIKYFK